MKKSYILAATIFLVAGLWILSGQFGEPIHEKEVAERNLDIAAAPDVAWPVRVSDLAAQDHVQEIVLFGRTEADRKITMRARTQGHVETLLLDDGASVTEGAEILRLSMDDRQARLSDAIAAEEQFRLAYEGGRDLVKKSFRSQVTLAQNKAEWEAAKARQEAVELDIEHTRIAAPYDGIVDDIMVEIGDFVEPGDNIATVVDLDPLIISAEVTERDVFAIKEGGIASIRLANGEVRDGVVRFVSKAGNDVTRTFRIEVEVENADYSAPEGLTAELRLKTGIVPAHLVSPAILTLSDEGAVGVKAVNSDDIVTFYPIQIVADTAEGIWLGGLPDPVRIITVGQDFVRVGQKVKPVPEQITPATQPKPDADRDDNRPLISQPKPLGDAS